MRKTVLKLTDIVKYYNNPAFGIPAIDNLNLSLHEGEILGLIGESGSGKTTIGKSILKLTPINSGSISLFGKDITTLSERQFRPDRSKIQMVFQDLDAALNPNMTISATLSEIIKRHQKTKAAETKKQCLKLMADVHLDSEILERYPCALSGGQKRRIAIASALAVKPKIIIADEPTTGLDNYTQTRIMQLLLELQQSEKLSMILISHDLQLVKKMCQRIAIMYMGNIIEIGKAEKIANAAAHPYSTLLWQSHLKHMHNSLTANTENTNQRKHDIRSGLSDHERPSEGCRFAPRCTRYIAMGEPKICRSVTGKPELKKIDEEHHVACYFANEVPPE